MSSRQRSSRQLAVRMRADSFFAVACLGWVVCNGCATSGTPGAGAVATVAGAEDTTATVSVPAGFGSLRQDDIAIRLEPQGLIIRAIPLDEDVIRLLTPDSYRALRDLEESNRTSIAGI